MLKAYKDFTHWSSAMRAYLMGGFFWPYVVGAGYGKEPADPTTITDADEKSKAEEAMLHYTINNTTGKELLFQAVGEDASAGYRDLETLGEVWNKLHEDRKKGDSRKLVEAVHALTNTPFTEGTEMEWFGKLEKATASLNKSLGIHSCTECKTAGRAKKLEELYGALVLFKLPEKYSLQKTLLQRGKEEDLALSNVKREIMLAVSDEGTSSKVSNTHEMAPQAPTGAFAVRPSKGGENNNGDVAGKNANGPGGGRPGKPGPGKPGKTKKQCTFCKRPNHLESECWNKKAAEYYKTNGTAKYFDPRGENNANANATHVSEDLDEEYDACLSVPYVKRNGKNECGTSFSSEYIGASVARGVKELTHRGLISDTLAQKMLALSSSDLEKAQSSLILDTGAALHLTGHTRAFTSYQKLKEPICIKGFGSDMSANAIGVGSITICPRSRSSLRRSLTVNDVYHVPDMPFGLLSVAVLLDSGYEFAVKKGHIDILRDGQYVGTAHRRGNLFFVDVEREPKSVTFSSALHSSASTDSPSLTDLMHYRFAHRNLPDL
jgi:hypothetical protein